MLVAGLGARQREIFTRRNPGPKFFVEVQDGDAGADRATCRR